MNLVRARHLHDDTLYEAYLATRRGVAIDPRLAEHLTDCHACEHRYAELVAVMDEVSAGADADLEQAFPAERRRAQQARILDRIAYAGRPARVLTFPGRIVARRLGAARPRVATRWIAAGAAAGLFIGVGLGLFLNVDGSRNQPRVAVNTAPPAATASRQSTPPARKVDVDDAFLSDLDLALETPRTPVLLGYDALTPRVRDVADIRSLRYARGGADGTTPAPVIFRKGLDLRAAVAGTLAESYHSALVDQVKADDFTFRSGRLTVHLAREFGFCYGVDRAVDYAYQTRERFPDPRVFLTGEIIHNPHVNEQLRAMGIGFLSEMPGGLDAARAEDVVILPAFGVTIAEMQHLERRGCTLVDTTCGSVLNVWKNVRRYAEDGFTSVIHGKAWHEETQATASHAVGFGGHYLVVFNNDEADIVCRYVRDGGDSAAFVERFAKAVSPAFDPDRDLARIGLANQTTMLMSESIEIGNRLKAAMLARYGAAELDAHFRAFDTICSATQDRQDAVVALLRERPVDLMLVIGGYNSSNTCNLARICAAERPTFHIAAPGCLESAARIRHRPVGTKTETSAGDWLPAAGPVVVGLTSGASTPDNLVGQAIARLAELCSTDASARI